MSDGKGKKSLTAAELRRQAEALVRAKAAEARLVRTEQESQRAVHELEVHQVELQMQNQELRRARAELESSRDKYAELYDFAPVGYFSFDRSGRIREVNLAGAKLLGVERGALVGKPFAGFVADADGRDTFAHHLETVQPGRGMQRSEVRLAVSDGRVIHGQLQSVAVDALAGGAGHVLTSIVDGTAGKGLEAEIQDAREYAENIVEAVREPLVVLDADLKILTANHSFYATFRVTPADTIGKFIYDLGNRQWDIPKLRVLFEEILPHDSVFNGYEVEHDFLDIGRKTILLNARQISRKEIGSHVILLAMEDITERKRLEAVVQDAREYAENIVETMREPLVVLDADLKILTANHSFYQTFRVTPGDTIGNFIYDLGNRQWDIPKLRVLVEEILPHDTVINDYEVEHDFLDIGRKTILLNARQIFREEVGSRIILLAMEDITARKKLETEIQDAREYAENIVETVREPLVVLDAELKILTANPRFYDTFKGTPAETIGKFIYDLGNRQWDIPKLRVLFEAILPHGAVFNGYEVEHDFLDIGRKTILLNARQISRKKIGSHIILLAMEDITERKLAEERVGEVMRQQQAILDNIPNSAWLKDRKGRYVAVNDPFGRAFGLVPKDLVGKNDYDIYPRDLAVKYEKNFREVMATGARAICEESVVDRDGKQRHFEKTETPIFNDAGAVIGIIGIANDITSRKEVELTLRHDSTHDNLTGLHNRAYFDEALERLADDGAFPVSIVMADVNGLKTVNDTLGHEAGDNLIRLAAKLLLGAFRSEDVVARIGGDEFAVLLPGKGRAVAEEAVKRIMSRPEVVNGLASIAFGVASADSRAQLAEAVKLSDERMYRDKSERKKQGPDATGKPS